MRTLTALAVRVRWPAAFGLLLCLALAGCQTTSSVRTVTVCATIQQYSKADQQLLAAELRKQRPSPTLQRALSEWANLREQARACVRRRTA